MSDLIEFAVAVVVIFVSLVLLRICISRRKKQ